MKGPTLASSGIPSNLEHDSRNSTKSCSNVDKGYLTFNRSR